MWKLPGAMSADSRLNHVAIGCFGHAHGAEPIQTLRERARESGRDVLRDHHAGHVGGQVREHFLDRFRAAGGRSDRDERQWAKFPRRGRRRPELPAEDFDALLRATCEAAAARILLASEDLQLTNRIGAARLGHDFHRAGAKRLHSGLAGSLGQRANYDDRHGTEQHQFLEERQPIHAGHLDIQSKDIRGQRQNFVAGDIGIGRGADDFDIRFPRQRLAQQLAHDGRVVHDQHSDFLSRSRWLPHPNPHPNRQKTRRKRARLRETPGGRWMAIQR